MVQKREKRRFCQKCWFVNDVLHIGIRKKDVFGRLPVEWSHREVVVLTLSDSQLLFEIFKRIELPHSIELLIILSVTALHLAVVPGRKRPDQLMPDSQLLQCAFKQGGLRFLAVQAVCKLRAVVCLDALDSIGKLLRPGRGRRGGSAQADAL